MKRVKMLVLALMTILVLSSAASMISAAGYQTQYKTSALSANSLLTNFKTATSNSTGVSRLVSPITMVGYKRIGLASGSMNVEITIAIPLKNEPLLQDMVEEISTPGTPYYHHYLSKQQVMKMFIDTNKYNTVLKTLISDGFSIQSTTFNSIIVAQGSVANVKKYLGLNVYEYSNEKSSYYSASGNLLIGGVDVYCSNVTGLVFAHPTTLLTKNITKQLLSSKVSKDQANTFAISAYWPTALQAVYGADLMYTKGINGSGYNIGILDFYGDPYIAEQLSYFDYLAGLPDPPSFKIVPIGPYDPGLGLATGWAEEISLDVQVSHAMAPGANITLFIANGDLSMVQAIAAIDAYSPQVNDLSQSFSISEWYYSMLGPEFMLFNGILSDQYYEIGSLMGITFMGSSGDAGGSGYSSGPEGTLGYPADSPFNTAVGGTTTYINFNSTGFVQSFDQTAWSNYGFVPNGVNYGGSTGGVSVIEPKPWYQDGVTSPTYLGYPNGRMNPDISFNSNIFPGVLIVNPDFSIGIYGGTSESSPLFAGLLTLVMQYSHSFTGLINPAVYTLAENSTIYSKAFYPIIYGYNIPWVAEAGYNLVTGWGSLNVFEFAKYYKALGAAPTLNVVVSVPSNSAGADFIGEYTSGQTVNVSANITYANGTTVTKGLFSVTLQTLQGNLVNVPLKYIGAPSYEWIGNYTMPANAQGIAYNFVTGKSSNNITGYGFNEIFVGYIMTYLSPYPMTPYSISVARGLPVYAYINYLNGTYITNSSLSFNITLDSYSILSNTYSEVGYSAFVYNASLGLWETIITGSYPLGPMTIYGDGSYGYMEFIHGTYLQDSLIFPPVLVEPGVAAPGQAIFIQSPVLPPINVNDSNVYYGSTVNVSLINPNGQVVSTANLYGVPNAGYLFVPSNASTGLYTILINSSYDSYYFGWINGSFFGQIWISGGVSTPTISISPSTVYEGDQITIYANITDPTTGKEVQFGMYSAAIYPTILQDYYSNATYVEYIPLEYDSALNLWIGSALLPSNTNPGSLAPFLNGPLVYSGPYDVYVTGISANGIATTNDLSAQEAFYINPGFLLDITSPTSGNVVNATSSTLIISGTTTGVSVTINGLPVSVSATGQFNVTETLEPGLNVFLVTATDQYGNTETQVVTALYLPQILKIQAEINTINSEISTLNTSSTTELNKIMTLQAELTSLSTELTSLNNTYHVNVSNLQNEISSLQNNLSALKNTVMENSNQITSASSGISGNYTLGTAALIIALIGLIIGLVAYFRKPKMPMNVPKETVKLGEESKKDEEGK